MRLFLAIDIPQTIKTSLSQQLNDLQKKHAVFNWVQEQNYHMTLQFFGETQKIKEIIDKIKIALFEQEQFYLYATHLDLFMDKRIIIYVDFNREKSLEQLIKNVRSTFEEEFYETKKFTPHITVSRSSIPSKQQYFHLQKKIRMRNIELEFQVTELSLFESIQNGKKSHYRKIKTFPLLDRI
ncbi:2'-5' RNA ligase [Candidatus Roizmanbacteria bacterium RIFOXYB2_FULL_38_10]|nr:MAG: 2'-5' RNA ligase [Candidatus Roizmanbacteria bacterium RIFOXYA2_FULL_38_14]OGK63344.1 MAG: 2'-5' RNA ligase [Candidatus Roizmanbacteria bacterium RIFOXYA1_FULL_37_12]OGK65190.1 MAG: 2'-5' RNA ligase [Candidatus Roizmanbacteria bacterium RIFOXYB1_FULL_40_23]OGK68744.1 MAG: 2'-5' RNA ligase [Candidatus Roizmanbacteria bacterium RIFOXYB2_FULL_38_10]OGK69595.1 MAG: 2'-5' RNA ligase [Candidatus Roizmanbacteria bacterium RIFOXYC1_FULL_38_14]OGK72746.1 MAG: 2'-5' RNA ligase [Candidatus Roizma